MSTATENRESAAQAEGLAKRLFLLTMCGVLAYIGVVIALMSSAD
jgi:hypothetical protein